MVQTCCSLFRDISAGLLDTSSTLYWAEKINKDYGLRCGITKTMDTPHLILRQACMVLKQMGRPLVDACGVTHLYFRNLGPNKPYYPNHGYYCQDDNSVTINSDVFVHPDQPEDFFDHRGYFVTRGEQTLFHEMGHALDAIKGNLSLKSDWLKLSGWSETPKTGLKMIVIRDPGSPEVKGEWYYDPRAEFTRFYAKRNPWDDFADSFSFYVGNIRTKLPENKEAYFKGLLKGLL